MSYVMILPVDVTVHQVTDPPPPHTVLVYFPPQYVCTTTPPSDPPLTTVSTEGRSERHVTCVLWPYRVWVGGARVPDGRTGWIFIVQSLQRTRRVAKYSLVLETAEI